MRIAKVKLIKIFAVTVLLTASALWLCRDSLRAHYHLHALRHAEKQMFSPRPSTFLQVVDFLLQRPNRQGWGAICSHHEDALIRMGYFASRDFPLTNPHITAVQLRTNAQWHFGSQFSSIMVVTNGQRITGTMVASNSFVRIIAPAAEITDWNTLILTLDKGRLLPPKQNASNPLDLALNFAGFTNINYRLAAIFAYSNCTGQDVTFDVRAIEYQINGVWQSSTILPLTASGRTLSGAHIRNQTGGTMFVPVQTTNTPCRLRILCVEPAIGLAGAVDEVTDAGKSLANNGKLGTFTTFEGRNYEVTASSDVEK